MTRGHWTDKIIHKGKDYEIKLAAGDMPYVRFFDKGLRQWIVSNNIDDTLHYYRKALIEMAQARDLAGTVR